MAFRDGRFDGCAPLCRRLSTHLRGGELFCQGRTQAIPLGKSRSERFLQLRLFALPIGAPLLQFLGAPFDLGHGRHGALRQRPRSIQLPTEACSAPATLPARSTRSVALIEESQVL